MGSISSGDGNPKTLCLVPVPGPAAIPEMSTAPEKELDVKRKEFSISKIEYRHAPPALLPKYSMSNITINTHQEQDSLAHDIPPLLPGAIVSDDVTMSINMEDVRYKLKQLESQFSHLSSSSSLDAWNTKTPCLVPAHGLAAIPEFSTVTPVPSYRYSKHDHQRLSPLSPSAVARRWRYKLALIVKNLSLLTPSSSNE